MGFRWIYVACYGYRCTGGHKSIPGLRPSSSSSTDLTVSTDYGSFLDSRPHEWKLRHVFHTQRCDNGPFSESRSCYDCVPTLGGSALDDLLQLGLGNGTTNSGGPSHIPPSNPFADMFASSTASSYQQSQPPKANYGGNGFGPMGGGGNGFGPMGGGMGQMGGVPQQSQQQFFQQQQSQPVTIQQPYGGGGGNNNYNVFGTSNSDQGSLNFSLLFALF